QERPSGLSLVRARFDAGFLVTKERADALDGLEVLVVLDSPHGPAVDERLVDREIETVVRAFHARPVEWTLALFDGEAPASRAAGGRMASALLEKEQLDTAVRGGLESLFPARRRAAITPGLLAPPLDHGRFLLGPPALEHGCGELQQLWSLRVSLGLRPADDRALCLL